MSSIRTRAVRLVATVAVALAPAAAPATPAAATGPGRVMFVANVHFPQYPVAAGGPIAFRATVAQGVDLGGGPITEVTGVLDRVSVVCTQREPLDGVATGRLFTGHTFSTDPARPFELRWVGVNAVYSGAVTGTGLFMPNPLPACGAAAPTTVLLTGELVMGSLRN
jgi:hypothetical protein